MYSFDYGKQKLLQWKKTKKTDAIPEYTTS